MSCSPFDLKDYFLEELTEPQQRQMEAHVKTCPPCREELDRLGIMQSALFTIPDEEIPQRIAFVSDKIFEPSPWRRWWAGFWGSASRLGFASAAMLSMAIVVYALHPVKQAPPQIAASTPPGVTTTLVQPVSDADIQARIDLAVSKAVAQAEERQNLKTKSLMANLEAMQENMGMAAVAFEQYQKRENVRLVQNAGYTDPHE